MKRYILILFIGLAFLAKSSNATNYYVSNSGSNSNNGLSLLNAFETLQYASDIVSIGDSVFVENGSYKGFNHSISGTLSAPIVFFLLIGNNVTITEVNSINYGINVENADCVVIDGFIVNNLPKAAIRFALADNCTVRNCRCDNNYERGIFTGFTDDFLTENNICSNSIDEHGIYVSNSSDRAILRYNKCFGNNGAGIHLNADASSGGDGIMSDIEV